MYALINIKCAIDEPPPLIYIPGAINQLLIKGMATSRVHLGNITDKRHDVMLLKNKRHDVMLANASKRHDVMLTNGIKRHDVMLLN